MLATSPTSSWRPGAAVLSLLLAASVLATAAAQTAPRARAVSLTASTSDLGRLRQVDALITGMLRDGRLDRRAPVFDTLVAATEHHRLEQRHQGVPVWAGTITVQERNGQVVSTFGEAYAGLDGLDTTPALGPAAARARAAALAGVELGPGVPATLFVLARPGTAPRLIYAVRATAPSLLTSLYFIDAHTGALVERRLDTRLQSAAVGRGLGVVGGPKKVMAALLGGQYVLTDLMRPQPMKTYDFRGDPDAVLAVLNGTRPLTVADLASDADNNWTDEAAVDAHVYSGWAYDYFFKRFNRLGLDGVTLPIINIVHPVRRETVFTQGDRVPEFFANAAYYGGGIQVYGDGLPPGVVLGGTGQNVTFLSGALDVVAHEVAHGLTEQLEYLNEPGALTEVFSDVIGTSVEFFFQGVERMPAADYLVGEDVVSFSAIRSMSDPRSISNHPDHYSRLFRGTSDNGGVHVNAGVGNMAFYLAIEGGRNAVSGLTVVGVGARNRDQIERIFYRAFTLMLPARATYADARAATLQAARDLYGAGSPAETALASAWTAVGVL